MAEPKRKGKIPHHIDGRLHVTGQSRFIGEGTRPEGLLYIKILFSPHARARITRLDVERARAIPGIVAVLTARDIPGENQIGLVMRDEPLLPEETVEYVGQPVVIVVAETARIAEQGVAAIDIEYEPLPPVLTVAEAVAGNHLYVPARRITCGDVDQALKTSDHVVQGSFSTSAQEQFYMETQCCLAVPDEGGNMTLHSATQSTAEVQQIAARVLGLTGKDITVDVPRLGGAFGGKERSATLWACLAALACQHTGRPVELRLTRHEDMQATGKRHPYEARYKVGFNRDGKIQAYDIELNANGGAYADLSIAILERALLHAENSYYIPHARIVGRACRTNLPPNTAFRGFGAPQSIFVIEEVIERIARHLQMDPLEVRQKNLYRTGQPTPYGQPVPDASGEELFERLKKRSKYRTLRKQTDAFNRQNPYVKQGMAVVPVKFGISFTTAFLNQASALIWIYEDGTISLSHGGVEMGQEVNTKVAQVVARELGVSLDRIRQETANTKRVGNASPTAASSGSDLNGHAARHAALQLKERLAKVAAGLLQEKHKIACSPEAIVFADDRLFNTEHPRLKLHFADVVKQAHLQRVPLGAHGFYKTPGIYFDRDTGQGEPFFYFVYGCALAQVQVDLLTGHTKLLKVYIVHENGHSLNPAIDRGQIIGGFIQGVGWVCLEEENYDDQGRYLATGPSTYKIPSIRELPDIFDIDLVEVERERASVFRSKGIGEPPFMYAEAVWFAIRDALQSLTEDDITLAMPATPEAVVMAAKEYLTHQ